MRSSAPTTQTLLPSTSAVRGTRTTSGRGGPSIFTLTNAPGSRGSSPGSGSKGLGTETNSCAVRLSGSSSLTRRVTSPVHSALSSSPRIWVTRALDPFDAPRLGTSTRPQRLHRYGDADPDLVGADQSGERAVARDDLTDLDRLVDDGGVEGGLDHRAAQVEPGSVQTALGRVDTHLGRLLIGLAAGRGDPSSPSRAVPESREQLPLALGHVGAALLDLQLELRLLDLVALLANGDPVVPVVDARHDLSLLEPAAHDQGGRDALDAARDLRTDTDPTRGLDDAGSRDDRRSGGRREGDDVDERGLHGGGAPGRRSGPI